jgi:ketosteroid isomerase-like protein
VREGFLAWLAPTSVVFRPGPVSGLKTYEKQKPGWNGLLAWTPMHAAISADGKLGWSTGPWTWSRDSTQKKPDAHGEYMSVWRMQADGSWKAVLDCGVGHPAPGRDTPAVTYSAPGPGANVGSPLAARQSLYQADAAFAKLAESAGVSDAIARYGTDDIIVLREGDQRVTGKSAARDSIASREATARMVSNAQSVAGSGDLGYTYGTFVTGGLADADSSWYVHVWHRGAAASWKLAFQVVMPVAKPK